MMKILFKGLKIILGFLLVFFSLYFLGAFGLAYFCVPAEQGAKKEITIYLKSNGVHTDIVLPVRSEQIDWTERMPLRDIKSTQRNFAYVGIGWGDKGFYLETPTWAELKASVAIKAATGLSTTAIHATYYQQVKIDENTRQLRISKAQYQRLIRYIDDSFKKDLQGNYIHIKTDAVYGDTDAFYEAVGSYSMFHTCNTWTNKSLKACGQKAAYWTPFDIGILRHYAVEE